MRRGDGGNDISATRGPHPPFRGDAMVHVELVERRSDHALLALRGELSGQPWTAHLRERLDDHYVDDGVRVIRLDLSAITFMDNYGVAALVSLLREADERGKRLVVEGEAGQVREKLKVTGVLRLLQEGA